VGGNEDGLTKRQLLAPDIVLRSRALRRNASEPERRLFRARREAFPAARFRFQVPFGPYHADFCSHAAKLIVEVDGDTHATTADHDAARTRFLNSEGYRVIRFANNDVMQSLGGVIETVRGRMRGSDEA
jgi:very-short-patch-repair endonuclease